MDFLSNLLGGQQRQQLQDFAARYDEGPPYERISDEEASARYDEVARNLPEEDYRLSAREAFSRMSPEEREEFGRLLREQSHQQGVGESVDREHPGQEDQPQNPDQLAQMLSRLHQQQPDAVGNLMKGMLGGGSTGGAGGSSIGGMMNSPIARAAMAGITSMAVKRMTGGR